MFQTGLEVVIASFVLFCCLFVFFFLPPGVLVDLIMNSAEKWKRFNIMSYCSEGCKWIS